MNKFINKLQDLNIADKLNKDVNADPNDNLKQFIDIFTNLKNSTSFKVTKRILKLKLLMFIVVIVIFLNAMFAKT